MTGRPRRAASAGKVAGRVLAALSLLLGSSLVFLPRAEAATGSSAVTKTWTVQRDYLDSGQHMTVDSRRISMTVSQTTGLKSLQEINVSWSGAHPTGGTLLGGANGDLNSDFAQKQEYPFALFECRGIDSPTAPAGKQLTPRTCWTSYPTERFLPDFNTAWPAWRSDEFATGVERSAVVNAPANADSLACGAATRASFRSERWLPFEAADGTIYPGGFQNCASIPPEGSPTYTREALPTNETFAITSVDGTGQANFQIFTSEGNPSLGCSQTVPCALVAVPIEGVSCDPSGSLAPTADRPTGSDLTQATTNCETSGNFQPGQPLPSQGEGAEAVSGYLWWSASNWRNRITVPLTFAPPDNACSVVNSAQDSVTVFGSELLAQATTQWAPKFCLDKQYNFTLDHEQSSEPLARSLVAQGATEAAFTSDGPDGGYPRPTVSAPVAVTGFGIAFAVDDNNSKPVANLKLDARLLAKLLTESYPAVVAVKNGYPKRKNPDGSQTATLSGNPYNVSFDPEFQALNPGIPARLVSQAATLLVLNSSSDVIHALTSYINADPEARAWLNGTPDPWGMRVNPNYQDIQLPVDTWPLLDSYDPSSFYSQSLCPDAGPLLPLVAAPTGTMFAIGQDVQYALSRSQTTCNQVNPANPQDPSNTMVADGRQTVGHRLMLGLVSLGDAAREGLSLASLETQTAEPWDPSWGQFTDGTGRTFVAPTNASMKAAADLLAQDSTTGLWPIPYSDFHTASAATKAYPGTMLVYAAIPTKGLPKNNAKHYSQLLTYAAGPGQVQGPNQGQLPAGFLPMTAANGLGAMVDYTTKAAALVAAQQGGQVGGSTSPPGGGGSGPPGSGNSPPPLGLGAEPGPVSIPGGNSGLSPSSTTGPGGTTAPSGSGTTPGSKLANGSKGASPSTPSGPMTVTPQVAPAAQYTPRFGLGSVGLLLPIMLGVIVAAGSTAAVIRMRRVRKAGS